jgi:hypothetical protein
VKKSFNIQEFLHRKSKHHETKLMHSCSLGAFQRDQERDLKHFNFGASHRYKQNKTNKQPSFKDIYLKKSPKGLHPNITFSYFQTRILKLPEL